MDDARLAGGEQTDLDRLNSEIAALSGSEEEAQAAEALLRARRRRLAEEFCALDAEGARALFSGDRGERHGLITHCGLRDLPRDAEDRELAGGLLSGFSAASPPAPGRLLAAMLLFQGFELPVHEDLRSIPDWLLRAYARFLLATPFIFNEPGDADRYCDFAAKTVSAIHRYVTHHPELPLASDLRDIFFDEAQYLQIYSNESNLKQMYRERAQIFESGAFAYGARLAHCFPLRRTAAAGRRLRVGILGYRFGTKQRPTSRSRTSSASRENAAP